MSAGNEITTLKTVTLPAGKTISGTMTCNMGQTISSGVLNFWARTSSPTTVDSSEVVISQSNTTAYTQLSCPFTFSNTTSSSITIYLGYYQGTATYTTTVRATYTIF